MEEPLGEKQTFAECLCLSPHRAFSTSFIVSNCILLDLRYSVINHASGHFLFRPFSKINKVAILIPILQMRRLTYPVSPQANHGGTGIGAQALTLLYIPRTQATRGTPYYTPSPQSSVHHVHRKCSVNVCGQRRW